MVSSVGSRRTIIPLTLLLLSAVATLGTTFAASRQPTAPCPSERYSDVCPSDWFYPYVIALSDDGVVSGYSDGTFRPNNEITRGQIMKVVVTANGLTAPLPPTHTFADVPPSHAFYQWVEVGAASGVAGGYACGGTGEPCDSQGKPYFRPAANVLRGQLAKMIANARRWTPLTPATPTFNDVGVDSPFFGYVERVAAYGVIGGYSCGGQGEPCPGRYFRPADTSTRAQACKMVDGARTITPPPTATGTPPTAIPTSVPPTATRTSLPIPTATISSACPVFPANNIWNRNIAALPTHARSGQYIASMGASTGLHADFGSGLWAGGPIGIPFVQVPGGQRPVPINFTDYGDESDPGPYPVPTNAPIEGGPSSDGDRHVLVVDPAACVLYEMYRSFPQTYGSWDAASGAKWSLRSNALRTDTWTSSDAAGLPVYPGLARYDEVASGVIRHALRFTASRTQRAYLWPARHFASSSNDPNLPPMGLRVRLKASFDISPYPPQARVILQALKDYGMFLADNGSSWYISGAPDERWDNDLLHSIDDITGSDFEAVDESGLMIDPNSGQSR